jgi:hypothetical protein
MFYPFAGPGAIFVLPPPDPSPTDPGFPCPTCAGTDTFTYAGPGGPDFICFTCLNEGHHGSPVPPAPVTIREAA